MDLPPTGDLLDAPPPELCDCGALLTTEEERAWGACGACLNWPIGYIVTAQGQALHDRRTKDATD